MQILTCVFFSLIGYSKGFWGKKEDAKEGDVRLVGGPDKVSGRIEVFHDKKWGSVCDNYFNINAATVVCKQLGLGGGTPKWHAFYGQGSGPVYVGSMSCNGREEKLSECSGLVWDAKGCQHKEDAGVICQGDKVNEGDIRLVKGSKGGLSGRVEIYHLGSWGTVCSPFFGEVEAKVVCRQLGFSGLRAESKSFGSGSGQSFLSQLQCSGNEGRLDRCNHKGWTGTSCSHSRDAGVVCQRVSPQDLTNEGNLRLQGGRGSSSGRLEIFHNGEWGTVCKEKFDARAAHIVCKKLGFSEGGSIVSVRNYGGGQGPIWLHDVTCTGSERDLMYCAHGDWGKGQCIHDEDVALECKTAGGGPAPSRPTPAPSRPGPAPVPEPLKPGNDEGSLKLVGPEAGRGKGRLELLHNNQWGTVCDDGFDHQAALVACHQLGYKGVERYEGRAGQGEGTGPIWLSDVLCEGDERRLIDCPHQGLGTAGVQYCSHSEDIGLQCSDNPSAGGQIGTSGAAGVLAKEGQIRLVGGRRASEGRVEIYHAGEWGTVCDDGWDSAAADVLCRQLGYATGIHRVRGFYGYGTGPIWLDEMACSGTERSILDCRHSNWGVTDCSHGEDIGVECI